MENIKPVPECSIYTGKSGKTLSSSKAAVTAIIRQLAIVYKNSKADAKYTASIQKTLKGIASNPTITAFKKAAVSRRIFVEPIIGKIRFREGISEPNEKMVISLLEEIKNYKNRPKEVVSVFSKYTDKDLADELRRRGWTLTATKTTTIKL